MEHNRLTTTEARLQEELHVEQAVQDIVRLIKQAEQQQASSPDTDKVSQANSPASAVQEPIETTYEIPPHNFEQQNQKPNIIEEEQQVIFDLP
ncbi:hypothetical protein ANCDUO_15238 [Ancylostoma duodenale]|uniref:Uncharacterized protein n=1 Tax=Ancylostoma duodenale TaxID=51022 RepID=A0A0C2G6S0_9BILA|nr:hypothetical protein ANCDUO_15238 [Ancylostoma duodenale]